MGEFSLQSLDGVDSIKSIINCVGCLTHPTAVHGTQKLKVLISNKINSHYFEQTISRQPLNLLHRELGNIILPEMSQRFSPRSDCRLALSCNSSLVIGTVLPNLRACCWNSDLIRNGELQAFC